MESPRFSGSNCSKKGVAEILGAADPPGERVRLTATPTATAAFGARAATPVTPVLAVAIDARWGDPGPPPDPRALFENKPAPAAADAYYNRPKHRARERGVYENTPTPSRADARYRRASPACRRPNDAGGAGSFAAREA